MTITNKLKKIAMEEQARLNRNARKRELYEIKKSENKKNKYIKKEVNGILKNLNKKLLESAKKGKNHYSLIEYCHPEYKTSYRGTESTTYCERDGWEPDYMFDIVDILTNKLESRGYNTDWVSEGELTKFCVVW